MCGENWDKLDQGRFVNGFIKKTGKEIIKDCEKCGYWEGFCLLKDCIKESEISKIAKEVGDIKIYISGKDDTGIHLIATKNDERVGFLRFDFAEDESKPRNVESKWLWVNEDYRRLGIATILIQTLFEVCDGMGVVWITFWTGKNIETKKGFTLFQKVGFQEAYVLPDYYAEGIPTRFYVRQNPRSRNC